MVVPMERRKSDSEPKVKQHVGNGLNLIIQSNNNLLLVVGNDCSLHIEENHGDVKIIGDNSRVTVNSGKGKINCIGNNAKFFLSPGVKENLITCVGNNCEIVSGNMTKSTSNCDRNKGSKSDNQKPKVVKMTNLNGVSGISISNMNNFEIFNRNYFRGSSVPKVSVKLYKVPKGKK